MTVTTDSTTPPPPPPPGLTDDGTLATFGYRQELRRQMGRYASFAAGFSFISVLTTVFQFFSLGYSFGGPLFFWTWWPYSSANCWSPRASPNSPPVTPSPGRSSSGRPG